MLPPNWLRRLISLGWRQADGDCRTREPQQPQSIGRPKGGRHVHDLGRMSAAAGHAPYTYPPDMCDVRDHAKLLAFRAKRAEWVVLLEKDPLHSVSSQLSALVWQDAVFRLFNEAWRLNDLRSRLRLWLRC